MAEDAIDATAIKFDALGTQEPTDTSKDDAAAVEREASAPWADVAGVAAVAAVEREASAPWADVAALTAVAAVEREASAPWVDVAALMGSDAWEDRFEAVAAARRAVAGAGGAAAVAGGLPAGLFAFLAREAAALRSRSSREALLCLGDVFAAGGGAAAVASDDDVGLVVSALVKRGVHELRFLASAATRALHELCVRGDARVFSAVLEHAASRSGAARALVARSAARCAVAAGDLGGAFPVEALAKLCVEINHWFGGSPWTKLQNSPSHRRSSWPRTATRRGPRSGPSRRARTAPPSRARSRPGARSPRPTSSRSWPAATRRRRRPAARACPSGSASASSAPPPPRTARGGAKAYADFESKFGTRWG